MKFTIAQVAQLINGEVKGDDTKEIYKLAGIDKDADSGSICFVANDKYLKYIYTTNADAVIVSKNFTPTQTIHTTLILVEDPYTAFTTLLEQYSQLLKFQKQGIEEQTCIHESAKVGEKVYIGAFVYISENVKIGNNVKIYPNTFIDKNVSIGDNTVIYAGTKIYSDTIIGTHCTIHSGVVLGSDGFGFAPQEDKTYKTIPQLGNVILENNVSIGSNTTIDRATMPDTSTIIRKGVKLDNLIQVAHNVEIGENTVISAQTGISGSTKIGKNCMIAGQVGFVNSINIADNTRIGAQSGLNSDVKKENMIIQGYPAFHIRDFQKSSVIFRQLPDLRQEILTLKKELADLKNKK